MSYEKWIGLIAAPIALMVEYFSPSKDSRNNANKPEVIDVDAVSDEDGVEDDILIVSESPIPARNVGKRRKLEKETEDVLLISSSDTTVGNFFVNTSQDRFAAPGSTKIYTAPRRQTDNKRKLIPSLAGGKAPIKSRFHRKFDHKPRSTSVHSPRLSHNNILQTYAKSRNQSMLDAYNKYRQMVFSNRVDHSDTSDLNRSTLSLYAQGAKEIKFKKKGSPTHTPAPLSRGIPQRATNTKYTKPTTHIVHATSTPAVHREPPVFDVSPMISPMHLHRSPMYLGTKQRSMTSSLRSPSLNTLLNHTSTSQSRPAPPVIAPLTPTVLKSRSDTDQGKQQTQQSQATRDTDTVAKTTATKGTKTAATKETRTAATNDTITTELVEQTEDLEIADPRWVHSWNTKLNQRQQEAENQIKELKQEENDIKELKRQIEEVPIVSEDDEEDEEEEDVHDDEDSGIPQLSDDDKATVRNSFWDEEANESEVLSTVKNIEITRTDMLTVRGYNWLNDNVINGYLSLLVARGGADENIPTSWAHSTFFYPKLKKDGYKSVKRWTKPNKCPGGLFSKDIIIIPMHLKIHWACGFINFRTKTIEQYDSLGISENHFFKVMRAYLVDEAKDKNQPIPNLDEWRDVRGDDCPRQNNCSDCGVFALKFADYYSRGLGMHFSQADMQYFRMLLCWELYQGKSLT